VSFHVIPSKILRHILKLGQERLQTPSTVVGVSLIKERGVLGADVPTAGCDEPADNTLEMVVGGGC